MNIDQLKALQKLDSDTNGAGIYAIINIQTDKLYIGSTNDFSRRYKQHSNMLKSGKHHCKHLQNSYKKHGRNSFIYVVVESIETQYLAPKMLQLKLYNREQVYLNIFNSQSMLYNHETRAGNFKNDDFNELRHNDIEKCFDAFLSVRKDILADEIMEDARIKLLGSELKDIIIEKTKKDLLREFNKFSEATEVAKTHLDKFQSSLSTYLIISNILQLVLAIIFIFTSLQYVGIIFAALMFCNLLIIAIFYLLPFFKKIISSKLQSQRVR